jgi:hypothetical protein
MIVLEKIGTAGVAQLFRRLQPLAEKIEDYGKTLDAYANVSPAYKSPMGDCTGIDGSRQGIRKLLYSNMKLRTYLEGCFYFNFINAHRAHKGTDL